MNIECRWLCGIVVVMFSEVTELVAVVRFRCAEGVAVSLAVVEVSVNMAVAGDVFVGGAGVRCGDRGVRI